MVRVVSIRPPWSPLGGNARSAGKLAHIEITEVALYCGHHIDGIVFSGLRMVHEETRATDEGARRIWGAARYTF
jgi:hypothetical protein